MVVPIFPHPSQMSGKGLLDFGYTVTTQFRFEKKLGQARSHTGSLGRIGITLCLTYLKVEWIPVTSNFQVSSEIFSPVTSSHFDLRWSRQS